MQAIMDWMEGDANDEYFYLENDDELRDGKALVSAAGKFSFWMHVENLVVECDTKSDPVKRWLKLVQEGSFSSAVDLLAKATAAFKEVSDDMASDEEADTDEDEETDDARIVVAESTANPRSKENIEKERMFEELLKTLAKHQGTQAATDRILSDYKSIYLSSTRHGWDAAPHNGNLYVWQIRLFDFDKGTPLYDDFQKLKKNGGKDHIEMLLTFPEDYPFKPPFLRVLSPKFERMTGRVTIGGSICHELLTNKGWKPVNDLESIIETVRAEITDPEAKARLDLNDTRDYQVCSHLRIDLS